MARRRPPIFAAPKADFRERLKITGGAVVAILCGLFVGLYLSDLLYQ